MNHLSLDQRGRGLSFAAVVAGLAVACGSSSTGPNGSGTPPLAIAVSVAPNPVAGVLCTGCGAGSTEREVRVTITVNETGGGEGSLTGLSAVLRDDAGLPAAMVDFDASFLAEAAGGSNRVSPRGRITFPNGLHYSTSFLGRAGSLSLTLRAADSRGGTVTAQVIVPVNPM